MTRDNRNRNRCDVQPFTRRRARARDTAPYFAGNFDLPRVNNGHGELQKVSIIHVS